ncbi:MAG: S1 RNA-binding domain-containing protein [Elusimicrobiota bacterium]
MENSEEKNKDLINNKGEEITKGNDIQADDSAEQKSITSAEVEETDINEEMTMEEILKSEENITEKLYNREIVYVRVVDVRSDYIYVDIGEKNEGLIPVKDFEGFKLPNIGTKIVAVLDKRGNSEKNAILSYRRAKEEIMTKWIEKAYMNKERVKGKVVQHVKGGYLVGINGVNAFMPLSLSELGGAPRHYLPINAKIKFYITEFDPKNKKIIASRRAVLEEDEKQRREKIISQTKEGDYTRVVVSKIIDSGIFVRYQGIEGFVKLEDVDWKNPKESIKQYARGQRIKVKVLSIDREKQNINFGIKQTKPNPIDILKRKFPMRSIVKGKVIELGENFARVHIIDDVYGVISEEDYSYEGAPEKDSVIDLAVIGVNPQTYELKLSIKKYEQIENRKRLEQYTRQTPKITLGQLLKDEGK